MRADNSRRQQINRTLQWLCSAGRQHGIRRAQRHVRVGVAEQRPLQVARPVQQPPVVARLEEHKCGHCMLERAGRRLGFFSSLCSSRPRQAVMQDALTIGRQHCYELHAEAVAASGSDGRQQLHFDRVTARDRISMMRGLQVIRLHCGRLANIKKYRFRREAAKSAPGR